MTTFGSLKPIPRPVKKLLLMDKFEYSTKNKIEHKARRILLNFVYEFSDKIVDIVGFMPDKF